MLLMLLILLLLLLLLLLVDDIAVIADIVCYLLLGVGICFYCYRCYVLCVGVSCGYFAAVCC